MTANAVSIINPEAQTMEDLILPSELEEIRNLARRAGLDPTIQWVGMFGVVPERLSRRFVQDVIEHLKAIETKKSGKADD